MKNLFRIHFTAIVVSDLLLLVTFRPLYELSLERGLIFCFIFILAQGLLLFRLVNRLKKHFSEIDPQINKKIRFYYLGVLTIDFILFILFAFISSQRFSTLMPIVTACHSTLYYRITDYLRENYPDFYDKHISLWECL